MEHNTHPRIGEVPRVARAVSESAQPAIQTHRQEQRVGVRGRSEESEHDGGVAGEAIQGVGYGGVCRLQPQNRGTPIDRGPSMPLIELLQKQDDGDFFRAVAEAVFAAADGARRRRRHRCRPLRARGDGRLKSAQRRPRPRAPDPARRAAVSRIVCASDSFVLGVLRLCRLAIPGARWIAAPTAPPPNAHSATGRSRLAYFRGRRLLSWRLGQARRSPRSPRRVTSRTGRTELRGFGIGRVYRPEPHEDHACVRAGAAAPRSAHARSSSGSCKTGRLP